jgi:hypothetical protein
MDMTERMFNVILEIWGSRQQKTFTSILYRIVEPTISKKLSLLERIFAVFEASCPPEAASQQYLHILRLVFEMHIRLAHHTDESLNRQIGMDWVPVLTTLRECEQHLLSTRTEYANSKSYDPFQPFMEKVSSTLKLQLKSLQADRTFKLKR